MDPDEFNPEDYEYETDLSNTAEGGPNDQYGYSARTMWSWKRLLK
jgi:hypothetical protein